MCQSLLLAMCAFIFLGEIPNIALEYVCMCLYTRQPFFHQAVIIIISSSVVAVTWEQLEQ